MSNYPQPPPSYSPSKPKYGSTEDHREPLLGDRRSPEPGPSAGGIYNQPRFGDVPDDFKYGVSVSESSLEIRNAFVRKVYTILFAQILSTTIVAGVLSQSPSAVLWVQANPWSYYLPMIGVFINLGLLYWKRHNHPANLILLSTFTLLEAFTLGIVCAYVNNTIVIQALLITLGVFLGLTAFTFQSKYDFSGMGPWLFGGLIALCMTGIVGIFIPFSRTIDLLYAIGGTILFSGYIVYDTYMINARLSPDEYIMAAISLYLDFINLFLSILRLLNNLQND
ncbi:UPF0005-domain-containing protein [Thelephora terrestris]|uniref:UPF0005-domain-containing protein n=1 Tax=Thelephora terrestris TaxID=56493 RepID=A0A9P6L6E3_9AGAM|nr:UPF0005-domain-containing protein [Thelephora terrestris]